MVGPDMLLVIMTFDGKVKGKMRVGWAEKGWLLHAILRMAITMTRWGTPCRTLACRHCIGAFCDICT